MGVANGWSRSPVRAVSPESTNLGAMLAKQIEASGPISVAEFMRAANQAYYAKGDPLGVQGDFITAPEISQMFGELVGLWLTDFWIRAGRPEGCAYVELGPGRGTLAVDALRSMRQFGFEPDILFVETSEHLRMLQAQAVPKARFAESIDELPYDKPLLVVANEFFDALPVRQLVSTHAGWRERVIVRDRGAKFMATPGPHAMDEMVPAEFRNAPSPTIYETCPAASSMMYELAGRISSQGGGMLIADYGYTMPGIGNTLQAVKGHKSADPFENPGNHDLTAHVNFVELANLARMGHLRVSGPTEQGGWLKALGIEARSAALIASQPQMADEIAAAQDRLLEPAGMGSLFKVLGVSHPDWPEPEGFEINQSLG